MAKKPPTTKKDPRLMAKGHIVWLPDLQREEVVRNVHIVLQLANGESRSYVVGEDEIEEVPPPAPIKAEDLPKPIQEGTPKEEGE